MVRVRVSGRVRASDSCTVQNIVCITAGDGGGRKYDKHSMLT